MPTGDQPANPTNPTRSSCWWFSCLLLLAFGSCNYVDYSAFNPETVERISEKRMKRYANTDSTVERLNAIKSDRKRLDSLILYAEWLKNYDEDAALLYAKMAYDLSTDRHWKYAQGVSAFRLASLKEEKARYGEDLEDALVDVNISKRIFEESDKDHWRIWVNSLIGKLFYRQNKLDSARQYLKSALNQIEEDSKLRKERKDLIAGIMHDLAETYSVENLKIKSNYYEISDSIFEDLGNQLDQARLWNDVGKFKTLVGKYEEADSLFELSIAYGKNNNDIDVLKRAYEKKAYLLGVKYYYTQNDSFAQEAIAYLHESLVLAEDNRHGVYDLLGWIYEAKWGYGEQLVHVDSAIYYNKLCLEEAQNEGALNVMKSVSNRMAYICSFETERCEDILGSNVPTFLNTYYIGIVDTITSHSRAAFQRTNQVEQREIVANAKLRQRNQLFYSGGLFVIAILTFLLILQYFRQQRLQSKMEALRAQINPHFISNSLNAIENLVNQDQKKAASKYIIHFSRLSRRILNSSLGSITSLAEELKTAEHFLALEGLRFPDKLSYTIDVAEDIDQDQIQIPALILQPYLENAIWHGIKPKTGKGQLQIKIRMNDKLLECIIEDDGVGREKARELKAKKLFPHQSVGMKITQERIQSFGKTKGTKVEIEDLYDESGTPAGTKVIIKLPLKYTKVKQNEKHTGHFSGR